MPYDPLRHLRRSIRLVGYDYSHAGAYFFTLVSDRRAALFGEVSGGAFTPSILGEAVQRWWDVIPRHFAGVACDEFVLMPNHMHCIVVLGANFSSPPVTLGKIVAFFKYQSTREINQIRGTGYVRVWQRNYFERIIRDDRELNATRKYIADNPVNWPMDRENAPNTIR